MVIIDTRRCEQLSADAFSNPLVRTPVALRPLLLFATLLRPLPCTRPVPGLFLNK